LLQLFLPICLTSRYTAQDMMPIKRAIKRPAADNRQYKRKRSAVHSRKRPTTEVAKKPATSRQRITPAFVEPAEVLAGATAGGMSRVLSFGTRSKPRIILVMLHGLNDTAVDCAGEGWAAAFAKALPGVLVAVPQAPDLTYWSHEDPNPGYDWLNQPGLDYPAEFQDHVQELQRLTTLRMRHLNQWLNRLLRRHKLGNENLVLAGFSQGSILATLCGASRGVRGVIVCGGVPIQPVYSPYAQDYVGTLWPKWEDLLPSQRPPVTPRFCVVNGTADTYVPRRELEYLLAGFKCHWHWEKGVGHDFPSSWRRAAVRWFRQLFNDQTSAGK